MMGERVIMGLIGHSNTKERISIALKSATARNSCIPHMLLAGAAGCGKTTTARWLANLGGYDFLPVSPLVLKSKKDVYTLLSKLSTVGYNNTGDRIGKIKPTILFFDEIHQMPVIGQEVLGIAMERFDLESDEANKLIWLPYFAVVGATTDDGLLNKPFRERFKIKFLYAPYDDKDMYEIVCFHTIRNGLSITPKAVRCIVNRSRGVPRTMVRYLETVRDFMVVYKADVITSNLVESTFKSLGIDKTGLTPVDVGILKALYGAEKPIGLENLAIITNESAKAISQATEPYLIQRGFILRTGKGRIITQEGRNYLEEQGHLGGEKPQKMFIDATHTRR